MAFAYDFRTVLLRSDSPDNKAPSNFPIFVIINNIIIIVLTSKRCQLNVTAAREIH